MGTDRRVVSLSVAKEFVCAILDNRSVKCFGRNSYGQLGYGDTEHRGDAAGSMGDNLPSVDFGTGRYAVRLFPSSGEAMCALLNTAEVKCWGRNANYVLGMGIAEERNIGDNANEMGDNLVAISIPLGKMVINLWVANHVIVLLDDHTITGWGGANGGTTTYWNGKGPLGAWLSDMGTPIDIDFDGRKPVQVSLNKYSTIVLFDNGDVVGFGTNIEGSLGNVVGGRDQAALLNFGTGVRVKGLARNTFDSRCVVLGSNEVKCWGLNTDGQLGVGDTMTRGMDASHMGDTLPVVHLHGRTLAQCAGVGQQPVCVDCSPASFWSNPVAVPNTAMSIVYDAVTTTGVWNVVPDCLLARQTTSDICYDRMKCYEALQDDTKDMPAECTAYATGGQVSEEYDDTVAPQSTSSFPFYCTENADVSFLVHHIIDPSVEPHPVRLRTQANGAWKDVAFPIDSPAPIFAMGRGVHILTVGAYSKTPPLSHIQFQQGSGSCYFSAGGKPDTAVCTQCPMQQETYLAQKVVGSCQACTAGSTFLATTNECTKCAPGSYNDLVPGVEHGCHACGLGEYSNTHGSTVCTQCTYDKYADSANSNACTECPFANMVTCACANTCVCLPGYELINSTCTECPVGHFRSDTMLHYARCVPCPSNLTTTRTGSDSCDCLHWYITESAYEEHTEVHLDGTVHDQFVVTLPDDYCVPCPSFQCTAGDYQLGILGCENCPDNSVSEQGSFRIQNCSCDKGYGGTDDCQPCAIGSYKSVTGMTTCVLCPNNGSTTSLASDSVDKCECGPGFILTSIDGGQWCTPCPDTGYKASFGDLTTCVDCPDGLNTFKTGATLPGECVCAAGTEMSDTGVCIACINGSYNAVNGGTCSVCPAYSRNNLDFTFCECQAGYSMINASIMSPTCVECEVGWYKSSYGNTCDKCPTGTTSDVGATTINDCMCGPGTRKVKDSYPLSCVACDDTYRWQPGYTLEETCLTCAPHSTSSSTDFVTCKCERGKIMNDDNTACALCPINSFTPEGQENSCDLCALVKPFTQGTLNRHACECMPGSQKHIDGACRLCLAGNYQTQPNQNECRACGLGTYSSIGASSCTDCAEGTVATNPQQSTCTTCTRGKYANYDMRKQLCKKCDPDKWSAAGSRSCHMCLEMDFGTGSAVDLQLQTGFEDTCMCPIDTVADGVSSEVCDGSPNCGQTLQCTKCAAQVGADNTTVLITGTHGVAGATSCTPCPLGQWLQPADLGNGTMGGCISCMEVTECDIGATKPLCTAALPLQPCVTCKVVQIAPGKEGYCFGFLHSFGTCGITSTYTCVVCNVGLLPDGRGGCRAAGRRFDSVAYEDDKGRVFDINGTVLWDQVQHVLSTFSYGPHWTCGIAQYSDRLYMSQNVQHILDLTSDIEQLGRKTVSVDCRYESVCALFDVHDTHTTAVHCLNWDEWVLPWKATSIVRGAAYACALLDDGNHSVYCFGDSAWGNVPYVNGSFVRLGVDARKLVAGERTTCAVDHTMGGNEYGRVHCWGFSHGFFGRYENTDRFTSIPTVVDIGSERYVRDLVILDSMTDASLHENVQDRMQVALCMLLDDYRIVCRGIGIHQEILEPWRIGPYHASFPTGITHGVHDGEICVVYNYYDVLCWNVYGAPPPSTLARNIATSQRALLQHVMEPTLFYTRTDTAMVMQKTAFIYPDVADHDNRCDFNFPYCEDDNPASISSSGFAKPGEWFQPYPLLQRWYYLIDLLTLNTPQTNSDAGILILKLPQQEPLLNMSIWYHRTVRIAGGGWTGECTPYLSWSDKSSPLLGVENADAETYEIDPREKKTNVDWVLLPGIFTAEYMTSTYAFVSVHAPVGDQYTDINVTIGNTLLTQYNENAKGVPSMTFRDWRVKASTRLPAIDTENERLVWVALQTGAYEDRWSPVGTAWFNSYAYLGVPVQEGDFEIAIVNMETPINSFHVGICPENQQDSDDEANNGASTGKVTCEPCLSGYIKPMAHLTSCVLYVYDKSSDGSNELFLERGFDGSIRMRSMLKKTTTILTEQGVVEEVGEGGEEEQLNKLLHAVAVAKCKPGTVINPYMLDDSGNPRCSDCLSIPCKPWALDYTVGIDGMKVPLECDTSTGSRTCIPNTFPIDCEHWMDASMRCMPEAPHHVHVDTYHLLRNESTQQYIHSYGTSVLDMVALDDVGSTHIHDTLSYTGRLQSKTMGYRYEIVSLGRSQELLAWKKAINPAVTLGVHWMKDTEALDLCIGTLCIRYLNDMITVSIPSNASLATTRIRGDTFDRNTVVYDGEKYYTPLFFVNNVTVMLKTHNDGAFALTTSVEMESVQLYTMGKKLDLGISYEELYEHIARTEVANVTDFPYVFAGMQFPGQSNIQHEKRFLGPSNFRMGTLSPSVAATTDKTLAALLFITPCFDKFVNCGEVKTVIMFSENGVMPVDMRNDTSQDTQRRRRLLAQTEINDPDSNSTSRNSVLLDDAAYSIQVVTPSSSTGLFDDIRFSTRFRIHADAQDGLILSNMDNVPTMPMNGFDMQIRLANTNNRRYLDMKRYGSIEIHICGFVYRSLSINQDDWHEFGFTIKTGSIITIFHNNEALSTYRLDMSGDNRCTFNNSIISIGRSEFIPESDSAVGVELQYVFLNSDISVVNSGVFVDSVFTTDVATVGELGNFTGIEWTEQTVQILRKIFASYVQGVHGPVPISTYAVVDGIDVVIYLRVYMYTNTEVDFNKNVGFINEMNHKLSVVRLPPLAISQTNGISDVTTTIVPFLKLRYERIPALFCASAEYEHVCIYDKLILQPHTPTLNGHAIRVYYNVNNSQETDDFFTIGGDFTVVADDLLVYIESIQSGMFNDTTILPWGAGQHAAIEFVVRTGPDDKGFRIDSVVEIPTDSGGMSAPFKLYIDAGNRSDYGFLDNAMLRLQYNEEIVVQAVLPLYTGFQHVRVAWFPSGDIQLWVEGVLVATEVAYNQRPGYGNVLFKSRRLVFTDSIRELSSLHFSSTTSELCECKSTCRAVYYHNGENCVECPVNMKTLVSGAVSIHQCMCNNGFTRVNKDDPQYGCDVQDPPLYEYNSTQLVKKGFCSNDQLDEADIGCSCLDSCHTADPYKQELLCCRNKCSMFPDEDSEYCDCRYNTTSMKSYNAAPTSTSGALCAAFKCAAGQKSEMGECVPCGPGWYQPNAGDFASETCSQCESCESAETGRYRDGCSVGNAGRCKSCTVCKEGEVTVKECDESGDAVCSQSTDCTQFGVECPDGSYHAGCDPKIGERGWCHVCPVQHATECPSGFFLNFECKYGIPDIPGSDTIRQLSRVPNECLPCNRFQCREEGAYYPTVNDCGNPDYPRTLSAATIECTGECTEPTDSQWVERRCQFSIANDDIYYNIR